MTSSCSTTSTTRSRAESPETTWTDANKAAFLKAIHDDGKGLVVIHHASGSFTKPNWVEFEKAVGGWRTQGFHGPAHEFTVKKTAASHPISEGAPAEFAHVIDELYQNSLLPPGSVVLATAYSDPSKPRGTGKDEAVIWASTYGKGRVFENVLGHDVATINDPGFQAWTRRGVDLGRDRQGPRRREVSWRRGQVGRWAAGQTNPGSRSSHRSDSLLATTDSPDSQ